MSKVWSFIIVFSIIVAIITGSPELVINSIMNSGKNAVENVLTLIGMMCFWSGIFRIFGQTSAVKKFAKVFSKPISKLFDKNQLNDKAVEYMSMNISSNILGVGNAATINGIKAIEELQKENPNKDSPSDNMTTFILINTASLQLIPTSMIALRTMYGSSMPTQIVIPIWIVSVLSLISGVVSIKILNRKMR